MTYASIAEAWGSVSGSNQLSTNMHPLHKQQIERIKNNTVPKAEQNLEWKTTQDPYRCLYAGESCNKSVRDNNMINQQNKLVAQGLQPQLGPGQQPFVYLPQYPWYPYARQGYMDYGPMISNMWYSNPYGHPNFVSPRGNPNFVSPRGNPYNGYFAGEIEQYQKTHDVGPMTQIGPYYGQGFGPLNYFQNANPPVRPKGNVTNGNVSGRVRREHFGNGNGVGGVSVNIIYFMFFMITLAVILCICMICILTFKTM